MRRCTSFAYEERRTHANSAHTHTRFRPTAIAAAHVCRVCVCYCEGGYVFACKLTIVVVSSSSCLPLGMSSTALLLLLLLLFCLQTHTILTTRTHLGSFGGSSSIRNVRSARSEDNLALLRDRRSPRGVHSETDHRTGQLTKVSLLRLLRNSLTVSFLFLLENNKLV